MKRRQFLKRASGLAVGSFLLGLYTWQIEPFWLEFVHLKMKLKHLPHQLKGKKLMQISDIHVGPNVSSSFLAKALRKAEALNPDYVVYTGDFIHYENEHTFDSLRDIMARAPKGKVATMAILGNHDYGEEKGQPSPRIANMITQILEASGIRVLRNSKATFENLNFIGLDDLWGTNFHPYKVMEQVDLNQANIVLCHNPDVCDISIWNGYKGWILSGHTHGGQCRAPFASAPFLPVRNRAYDQGLKYLGDGRTLYINRALGHFYQFRFNVRPEITIFELVA